MSQSQQSIILSFLRNFPPRTLASTRNYHAVALMLIVTLLLFTTNFFRCTELVGEVAGRNVNLITPEINSDILEVWNVVSEANHTFRALKAADSIPPYYTEFENEISESSLVWADILMIPKEILRSKQVTIDAKVLKTVKFCPQSIVANLSLELAGLDLKWCKWSLSATGGQVKVNDNFGILTKEDVAKFHTLGCRNVINGKSFSCDNERGDSLIQTWRQNRVEGLCESNAESKVDCFDSADGSRYCQFENAMMNFKKMRQKTRADGTPSRSWEQGFLAASCGEKGLENIGYTKMYKPDIDGSSDAVCDYIFNETVIAYSHDNIKSFTHMFSDYLNIQSLLWLSGNAAQSQDVTLLNIDSFRMQPYFGDQPNDYFYHYFKAFRRVLRAQDFGPTAKVCFKNLIMQPKPEILFSRDGWRYDLRCSFVGPSSLHQRWNLQMRMNLGLMTLDELVTEEVFRILLVRKASKLGAKSSKKGVKRSTDTSNIGGDMIDKTPSALGISNTADLGLMLTELCDEVSVLFPDVLFEVVEQDLDLLSFAEQVALLAKSSILIGMHGTGIPISMHMPVGSKYCCGVIEIFPGVKEKDRNGTLLLGPNTLPVTTESSFKSLRGHGNMARRMGYTYTRIDLVGGSKTSKGHRKRANADSLKGKGVSSNRTSSTVHTGARKLPDAVGNRTTHSGTNVSPDALRESAKVMILSILKAPSCLLPAVIKKSL